MRDHKKNNFLHLISKGFLYKSGDMAHSNYEFIIGNKLGKFAENDYTEILKRLAIEKNFEGISPIKMALENNQYGFIKILCDKEIIKIFEPDYEEDIVAYLLRFA